MSAILETSSPKSYPYWYSACASDEAMEKKNQPIYGNTFLLIRDKYRGILLFFIARVTKKGIYNRAKNIGILGTGQPQHPNPVI